MFYFVLKLGVIHWMNNKTLLDMKHCWPTTSNIIERYMLRQFALSVIACCCMLLGIVALSLKPVKLLAKCKRT